MLNSTTPDELAFDPPGIGQVCPEWSRRAATPGERAEAAGPSAVSPGPGGGPGQAPLLFMVMSTEVQSHHLVRDRFAAGGRFQTRTLRVARFQARQDPLSVSPTALLSSVKRRSLTSRGPGQLSK